MKEYKYLIYFTLNSLNENFDCHTVLILDFIAETMTGVSKIQKFLEEDYCSNSIVIKNIVRLK